MIILSLEYRVQLVQKYFSLALIFLLPVYDLFCLYRRPIHHFIFLCYFLCSLFKLGLFSHLLSIIRPTRGGIRVLLLLIIYIVFIFVFVFVYFYFRIIIFIILYISLSFQLFLSFLNLFETTKF